MRPDWARLRPRSPPRRHSTSPRPTTSNILPRTHMDIAGSAAPASPVRSPSRLPSAERSKGRAVQATELLRKLRRWKSAPRRWASVAMPERQARASGSGLLGVDIVGIGGAGAIGDKLDSIDADVIGREKRFVTALQFAQRRHRRGTPRTRGWCQPSEIDELDTDG